MTKIKLVGMTAEIQGNIWRSQSSGFEKWLNAFCSEEALEDYYPHSETAMLNAVKSFFKNIEVLEYPKQPEKKAEDLVY